MIVAKKRSQGLSDSIEKRLHHEELYITYELANSHFIRID